jgi:4-aminobutyrate aminotransferase/(S)-3-amino-2-methylpropionate transaminase
MDTMARDQVVTRAARLGERLCGRLTALERRFTAIGNVRGLGAMVAMELVTDRETKTPAKALAGALQTACLRHGLLLLTAGTFGNVIRILVPLTVEDAVVDEGMDVLEAALQDATAG